MATYNYKSWGEDKHLLKLAYGIDMPGVIGFTKEMPNRANDAAPLPITAANNGMLAQFTNYIDPSVVDVIISPLKAEEIYGSTQKGDWADQFMTFIIGEMAGDTQAYNDFDEGGTATSNFNNELRENYLFQTNIQYGDLQTARMDKTPVAYVASLQKSRIRTLQVKQNNMFFFGIDGLKNFGSLTDPDLPAAISPLTKASGSVLWKDATAMEIYEDIMFLYAGLQKQNLGIVNLDERIDMDADLRLVVSNTSQPYLLKTNEYGISVLDLLKKNFPNLTQVSAPQLSRPAGELIQLFLRDYDGHKTFECTYSTRMKSHGIVRKASSFSEKTSQGGWGTILKYPSLVAQMIGV